MQAAAFSLVRRLLLCTTTTASPPARFVAKGYLVANCGLTPSQAAKASKLLSHLETPDQPDSVRAFLAGLNLSKADVAATITLRPRILCLNVESTLAPRISQLRGIGLSTPQIASLVPLVPYVFTSPVYVSRLALFISFFGSFTKLHATIKKDAQLRRSVERLEPQAALLRECGLSARDIAQVISATPRLFSGYLERLKTVIARAEELGVPRPPGHTHVPPRPRRGVRYQAGERHRQDGAAQVAWLV
jgi:mTERF domain-containing protein